MYNLIRRHRRPDNRDQAARELAELVAKVLKSTVATGLTVSGIMMAEGMEMDVYALGEQLSDETETEMAAIPKAPDNSPTTDSDATSIDNSPVTSAPDTAQVSIADPITEKAIDSAPSNDSSPAQTPEITTSASSETNSSPISPKEIQSTTVTQATNPVPTSTSSAFIHTPVSKATTFPAVKPTALFSTKQALEGNVRDTLDSIEVIAEDFDILTHEAEINTDLNANIKTDIYSATNTPTLGESEDFVATGEDPSTRIEIGSIREGTDQIIIGSANDDYDTAQQVENTLVLDTDIPTDTIARIEINGQTVLEDGKPLDDDSIDGLLKRQPLGKEAAKEKLAVIADKAEKLQADTAENYRSTVAVDCEGTTISTDRYFPLSSGRHEYAVANLTPKAVVTDKPAEGSGTANSEAMSTGDISIFKRVDEKLLINVAYKPGTTLINLGDIAVHEDNGYTSRGIDTDPWKYDAAKQTGTSASKDACRKLSDLSKEIFINFGGYEGKIITSGNVLGTIIAPNAEFVGTHSGLGKLLANKFTNNGGWIGNGVGKQAEQKPAPSAPEDDEKPTSTADDKKPDSGDENPIVDDEKAEPDDINLGDDKKLPEIDGEADPADEDKKPSEAAIQPQTETIKETIETLDKAPGKVLDATRDMEAVPTDAIKDDQAKTPNRINDTSTLDANRSRNAATGDTSALPRDQVAASIAVAGLIGYAGVSLQRPRDKHSKTHRI